MKRTLTGIAAAAMVLGTVAPAAFAATTSVTYNHRAITLGSYSTGVYGTVATDSGNQTEFLPFWYVQHALQQQTGYNATWDGTNFKITTPDGAAPDLSKNGGIMGNGPVKIYVNGTLVKTAPKPIVANDKLSGQPTSFLPIYYINDALATAGFTNTYDGTTWGLTAPVQTLAISSVSALNADQIQVVYATKVDATSAENIDNYSLNGTNLDTNHATTMVPDPTDPTASLQADGKTVIISGGSNITSGFGAVLATNKGYVVTVNGVQNVAKTQTLSSVNSNSFTFNGDTTPATVTSVSAKTNASGTHTVTVTYSEPVKATGLYYINGHAATFSVSTPYSNTVTLTDATDLLAGGSTYSFQVINESDTSGNFTNSTQNFTVVSDTTAPTVSSVTAVGDSTIQVAFSKAMTTSTLQGANAIKLIGSNGQDYTGLIANAATDITATDSTNMTYTIKLTSAAADFVNNQLPLTVVLSNSLTDSLGNALASTSRGVTLTLNTAAPAITSAQYVKPGASYNNVPYTHGAVVLTFNENLQSPAVSLTGTTQYHAITDNGVDESGTVNALTGAFGATNNVLVLTPNVNFGGTNSETIRFNAGVFTDASSAALTNAAVVESVSLTTGTVSGTDTTVPAVASVTGVPVANAEETITYTVTDADSNVDFSTVMNASNYRLNGAALPSGTYFTTNGTTSPTTVTIHLPQGSIATTGLYSLSISGIKDLGGNVAPTVVTNNVSLKNNTAPVLKTATFNADGSLSLGFSTAVLGSAFADYTIKVNGVPVTGALAPATAGQFSVSDGSGADAGKVVVKFGTPVAAGQVVSVTVAAGTTKDADGNSIATGSSVSVTR